VFSKLFRSILDSSIWLEAEPTRIVWLTLLAAKDEDGFARFATVENLAARARVALADTRKAVTILEGPDAQSSNPDHEGRRIERVPGGWMVLNAKLYDGIAKRETEREQVRERVRRHRSKAKEEAAPAIARDEARLSERLTTDAGRAALAALLAASESKVGVVMGLHALLDGMHPPMVASSDMDAALIDYVANGMSSGHFNAKHFRHFTRRAALPDDAPAKVKPTNTEKARRAIENL
jgi:hypothetical protein